MCVARLCHDRHVCTQAVEGSSCGVVDKVSSWGGGGVTMHIRAVGGSSCRG